MILGILFPVLRVLGAARLERADLVINNGAEVSSLDPAAVSGVPEGRVMYSLYEGLTVRHPETLDPLPGMARAWEVSEDGLNWTFHLRDEARWSNGDALGAEDFAWSWKRLLLPETAATYGYQLWYIEGAKDFTQTPSNTPQDRWWFDGSRYLHWSAERPASLRAGLHRFGQPWRQLSGERGSPKALLAALEAQLSEPAFQVPGAQQRNPALFGPGAEDPGALLASDPYFGAWLAELPLGERSLEEATRHWLPEPQARDELFWPLVGIKVPDARTLEVKLNAPTPFFIELVSFYPTFPVHRATLERARKEFPSTWQVEWIKTGTIVTNGPYVITERRINDRIRVRKNEHYWDRDNVAMQTIDLLALEHYGTMLNLYLTGGADWIDKCGPNLIPRMLPREDFNPVPYLGTYFYRVNVHKPPLDDKRVRRALALSIDRLAVCEKITKKGELPNWALSPDNLPGYRRPDMAHSPVDADFGNYAAALAADREEARGLLREAGYGPGGKPFPPIEILYNTSEVHRDIAEVLADDWRNELGIDAKLLNQEWKVYLASQRNVDYDLARSAWIGDYRDPNTFVDLFVGEGNNNRTGWANADYDALVEAARVEPDVVQRLDYLAQAEAILMDELPVLPIYTYVTQNLVNPRLGGFHENLQDDHFPKFFYWMSDEELAAKRAAQAPGQLPAEAPGPSAGLYSPNQQRAQREAH